MTRQVLKGLFLFLLISISQMPYAFSQSPTYAAGGSTPCGDTYTYFDAGTYALTVPAGVNSVRIQIWGAGGAGGTATMSDKKDEGGAGGGGGGSYSESEWSTFEGDVLGIIVGAGGNDSDGESSYVTRDTNDTPILFLVVANGGSQGTSVSMDGEYGAGGAGGSPPTRGGTITYTGGNGSAAAGGKGSFGGAGGSSAGTAADGDNAFESKGGSAPAGGGDGADGNGKGNNGSAGSDPGGGGSGGFQKDAGTSIGGVGGDGQIIITYQCTTVTDPDYPGNPDIGSCASGSGSITLVDAVAEGTDLDRIIIQIDGACEWTVPAEADEDGGMDILVLGAGGGGGAQAGGGGGAGGLIQVNIADLTTASITPGTSVFDITAVGAGGAGTDDPTVKGSDGGTTTIVPFSGFTISAGGGGGGGSEEDTSTRPGRNGLANTITGSATGFSVATNVGGSGGGAGHARDNTTSSGGSGTGGGNNGGSSVIIGGDDTHAGGGGGGSNSAGTNTSGDEQGGDGGDGSTFTIFGDRFYSAGGGGGGRTKNGGGKGAGGSASAGGDGGDDDDLALPGQTPGSGGGGADHEDNLGGNGADGAVIISYLLPRVLPIEYLYFTAVYNPGDRSGELIWATAKEWDNSHFEIERSENNVTSWTKIGELKGAGNSNTPLEYRFKDNKLPMAGGNIFYRIKQVDLDGDFTYSRTRALQVEPVRSSLQWRVYPNPTTGRPFNIELLDRSKYRDEPIIIRVISMAGQTEVILNNDIQTMGDSIGEWLSKQVNGVYTLEVSWGNHREYHKVILRK